MRAGAYTIHQSLTAEAAAVLKLALVLARQRGHAQVTPLHVAFALLTGPAAGGCTHPISAYDSPAYPAAPYGLLKRACLRSYPAPGAAAASPQHPLQWRALELCFNVALNRLPASGPHSSTAAPFTLPALIQPSPTLSNALVAALKRAQSNQRRGCVELQQPPPPPPSNAPPAPQPQQPLLAIKVELQQLVISILDDPSVSRVMREAGFSSATVKSTLEEESALMPPPSSPPPPHIVPPHFFIDPSISSGSRSSKGGDGFGAWPAQFLAAPGPGAGACNDDDVSAVLEVMVRIKQGRRSNPVVVGDSVSMAEAVAGELLQRLERGDDVPEELAGAHLLRLQLSYVHVRLMSRADVNARASELRRTVDAVQRGGGLVVYVGDLRWALDEEPNDNHDAASSYSPVDHMVAELGRLLDDLRASRGRAWLVATASYQTYMRWQQQQRRRRPLESAWELQAVVVPTGSGTGLSLNSSASSSSSLPSASAEVPPAMAASQQLRHNPFAMAGAANAFAGRDDEHDEMQLVLCADCTKNYKSEASLVKAEADADAPGASLQGWLVLDMPPVAQATQKKYLMELKRKWSRLCRKLHLCSDPCSPPCPWRSGSCLLPASKSKPSVAGFLGFDGLLMEQPKSRTGWWPSPSPPWGPSPLCGLLSPPVGLGCRHGVGTMLALGSHPLSDSATSDSRAVGSGDDGSTAVRDLEQRLRRNIPWQPGTVIAEIAKAVVVATGERDGGAWLYVKGSDHIATRRAVTVIAETRCGSANRVICADASKFSCAEELCSYVVSRASEMGGRMLVVMVHGVENASCDVTDCLVAASKSGSLKDHRSGQVLDLSGCIVILTASKLPGGVSGQIKMHLWSEDEASSAGALKRKTEESPHGEGKRARHDGGLGSLDLNLCAEDDADDDGAVPSDITDGGDSSDSSEHGQPHSLLEALAAHVVTLDKGGGGGAAASIQARLARAIGQGAGTGTRVEETTVQALAAASGQFLEEEFESWTAEVLEPAVAVAMVKNGGKRKVMVLGLGPGGGVRETAAGFMGSVLPSRMQVD